MIKRTRKPVSRQTRRFESRGLFNSRRIRRKINEGYSISFDEIYDNLEEEEGSGVADDLASDHFHEDVLNAINNVPCKRDQTLYWMVTDILKGNFKYAYEDLFEEVDLDHPTSICNRSDDNPSFYVNDDGSVEYSWGLSYETVAIKPADVASEDGSLENNKAIIGIAKELSQMPEGYKLSDDDCFEITKKHYPKSNDTAISYCFMPIAISNTGCGHDFDETLENLIYELTGDPFYSLLDMVILGM